MTPNTVLVASQSFGGGLDATRAVLAIGRGLRAANSELESDPCPLDGLPTPSRDLQGELRRSLDALDFDARMRRSRAVVIAGERLDHETLLDGDAMFEIATRARQAGVPCYAIAGRDGLDRFEARILDLQVVLEASGERGLVAAGRKLAGIV